MITNKKFRVRLVVALLSLLMIISAFPLTGPVANAAETGRAKTKKADLVFVIDSTGSMSDEIYNVKAGISAFTRSLEALGIKIRIGIVEYRDITADGLGSTIIHELNHSVWLNNTDETVNMLGNIYVDGGGDLPETVIDGLGYLVDDITIPWSSDAYKFAVVLTDANYKNENRHGYRSLQDVADVLSEKGINTSVITTKSEFSTYADLSDMTGGILADIYSDFDIVLEELAKSILGITLKPKKAIYVLPGYLGSQLYDGSDGTSGGKCLWFPKNIFDLDTIVGQNNLKKFYQDENSNGTRLHVDYNLDKYGVELPFKGRGTYEILVKRLEKDFGEEYDVKFFPYNWLEDLNDSADKLETHIRNNGYSEVVFVTHSTGGLLASAYISKSHVNKLKVSKAILIAAPLFGTYASLLPLERGDCRKTMNVFTGDFWTDFIVSNSWVRNWAKNSPTTYQLLPSSEYLQFYPLIDKGNLFEKTKAITSMSDYYGVLNQSNHINSRLTNGSTRSHKYFRNTVLNGDVVKLWSVDALLEVNTLLIGTPYGHSTTAVAVYTDPPIVADRKLKDIIYNKHGDGTVQYFSAMGLKKDGSMPLRTAFEFNSEHSDLVEDSAVLDLVCDEIRGLDTYVSRLSSSVTLSETSGISELIKIRYEADLPVTATIYDASNNVVAQATGDEYTGFDGEDFIYDSFAESEDTTEASIYMPNSGYRIVFTCGTNKDVAVNFKSEISTLVDDGWKDVSVTNSADVTLDNGLILSFDGISTAIVNDNILDVIDGTVENHFTNWELPSTIKVNLGDVKYVDVSGDEAEKVLSLLSWTSADESIVSVSSTGVLTAKGFGRTTIAATDGNKSSVAEVIVVQNATAVNLSDINMIIGEKTLIRPIFAPASATETELIYSVDKNGIIQIDEFGVIYALAAGKVTVTGTTSYGVSAQFTITVTDGTNYAVESILMPSNAAVDVGETIDIAVEFVPINATDQSLKWYVDDDSVISIHEGDGKAEITGLKAGFAKVTAVSADGGYVAECAVTVSEGKVTLLKGDVNGDGDIDAMDSSLILQYDAGIIRLAAAQLERADANGDRDVDVMDASLILQYDAGLVKELVNKVIKF